jgi:hypothetical protein
LMPCHHKTIAPDGYKTNASYERKTDALTAACQNPSAHVPENHRQRKAL